MENDYLKKWLDHSLTEEEKRVYRQTSGYNSLEELDQNLSKLKPPPLDVDLALQRFEQLKQERKKIILVTWIKPFLKSAAVVACLALSYVFIVYQRKDVTAPTGNLSFKTSGGEMKTIKLPDGSVVMLNAASAINFNGDGWASNRMVNLEGEAFFKIAKGSSFDVKTATGSVRVFGTQFTVKDRDQFFEVICYEGKVRVEAGNQSMFLTPGKMFRLLDGSMTDDSLSTMTSPSWISNISYFQSVPFHEVIDELERQYKIDVDVTGVDVDEKFTGAFTNKDLELALKSISQPLRLHYSIRKNHSVMLSK